MKKYLHIKIRVFLCAALIAVTMPQPYAFAFRPVAFKLSNDKSDSLFPRTSASGDQATGPGQGDISVGQLRQKAGTVFEKASWAVKIAERVYKDKSFDASTDTYLGHTSRVADTLVQLIPEIDELTVAAALLHKLEPDVLKKELKENTPGHIQKKEKERITALINRMNNVSDLAYLPEDKKGGYTIQNQMNMIIQLAQTPECMLLVFADKIEVIKFAAQPQWDYVFREITQLYAPLAERLGMRDLASRFRDEAFKKAERTLYDKITSERKKRIGTSHADALVHMEHMKRDIEKILKGLNIPARVAVRVKGVYSIYEKMESRDDIESIEDINDLLGIELVFNEESDLWAASHIPHFYGKPINGSTEIKRHEENKMSGITSFHAVIENAKGRHYEFQFMTQENYRKLQYGPKAHWIYKAKRETGQGFDVDGIRMTGNFFQDFRMLKQSLDKYVFVFAQIDYTGQIKLKPIKLPRESIPADFAALKAVDALDLNYGGVIGHRAYYDILHSKLYNSPVRLCSESKALETGLVLRTLQGSRFKGLKSGRLRLSKVLQTIEHKARLPRTRFLVNILGSQMSDYVLKGRNTLEDEGIVFKDNQVADNFLMALLNNLGLKDITELYAAAGSAMHETADAGESGPNIVQNIIQQAIRHGKDMLDAEGIDLNDNCTLLRLDSIYTKLPAGIRTPRQLLIAIGCGNITTGIVNDKLSAANPIKISKPVLCGAAA
jgi:hypothetical protein